MRDSFCRKRKLADSFTPCVLVASCFLCILSRSLVFESRKHFVVRIKIGMLPPGNKLNKLVIPSFRDSNSMTGDN